MQRPAVSVKGLSILRLSNGESAKKAEKINTDLIFCDEDLRRILPWLLH